MRTTRSVHEPTPRYYRVWPHVSAACEHHCSARVPASERLTVSLMVLAIAKMLKRMACRTAVLEEVSSALVG